MSHLMKVIEQLKPLAEKTECIDVYIRTHDGEGDGYAFVYIDDEGMYDVSYLQNRIPEDAWKTEQGIEEAQQVFQEGKQTWSKEGTLVDALNAIFDYWMIAREQRRVCSFEMKNEDALTIVICSK